MLKIKVLSENQCEIIDFDRSYFINSKIDGNYHKEVLVNKGDIFLVEYVAISYPLIGAIINCDPIFFDFFGFKPYQLGVIKIHSYL